jgi:nucleoside-diphosphate-sugar epimerase
MKIFVTGAGGFLGAAVVSAALDAGHEVMAMVRRPSPRLAAATDLQVVAIDMRKPALVTTALAAFRPQVVVHCAWTGLDGAQRQSLEQFDQVELCWRLATIAAGAGATRFVGIGSQDEYGPAEGCLTEEWLPRPVSAYGAAKLAAGILSQQAARHHAISFAWLRLFATYGPGDNGHWLIPSLTRQMLEGTRPKMTQGTQLCDYLYIKDAARGVVAAATTSTAEGVFNLSSGNAVPVRAIAERLRELAAPAMQLTFGEIPFGPGSIMHREGDNGRLMRATGWGPEMPLERGLELTVEDQRRRGASVARIPEAQE